MSKPLFGILLSTLLLSYCYENKNKAEYLIENITLPVSDSVVVQLKEDEHISKAIIRLIGEVDGSYIFNDHLFDKGDIDSIIYSHDWYQPIYPIEYRPVEAKTGYLRVKVEFL